MRLNNSNDTAVKADCQADKPLNNIDLHYYVRF